MYGALFIYPGFLRPHLGGLLFPFSDVLRLLMFLCSLSQISVISHAVEERGHLWSGVHFFLKKTSMEETSDEEHTGNSIKMTTYQKIAK